MDMKNRLELIENQLKTALLELKNIEKDMRNLGLENEKLKRELCQCTEETQEKVEENAKKIQGEGYDNLVKLYEEGFHICHLHFGQMRTEGDCLFCMGFLREM